MYLINNGIAIDGSESFVKDYISDNDPRTLRLGLPCIIDLAMTKAIEFKDVRDEGAFIHRYFA